MAEYIKLSDVLSLLSDNHDEDDGAFISVEDVLCLPTKNWDQGWIALTEEMPEKEERESDIRETLTKMFDEKAVLDFERALADALENFDRRMRRKLYADIYD